uniref:Uncharacterized protein n=1 Tax=Romanomermis culicivorax TaxID=13658 RepID=A0A915KT67_ROMCU
MLNLAKVREPIDRPPGIQPKAGATGKSAIVFPSGVILVILNLESTFWQLSKAPNFNKRSSADFKLFFDGAVGNGKFSTFDMFIFFINNTKSSIGFSKISGLEKFSNSSKTADE